MVPHISYIYFLILNRSLTKIFILQMTPGELKFALCVEAALNRIPEPEYRQLVVEMLMVLSLVVEYHPEQTLGDTIDVDDLVWEGHNLYLTDQVRMDSIVAFIFPYYVLLLFTVTKKVRARGVALCAILFYGQKCSKPVQINQSKNVTSTIHEN